MRNQGSLSLLEPTGHHSFCVLVELAFKTPPAQLSVGAARIKKGILHTLRGVLHTLRVNKSCCAAHTSW